ncbi:unnamed protein product [Rodentolepis nana]|uniref:Uncharacterized protein n=1 Tax=Rodentolepis nana TaxID=102285 RepID=A0A0R3TRG9_RODNA|nr:unnamed protein product [Rodentolepis nana]
MAMINITLSPSSAPMLPCVGEESGSNGPRVGPKSRADQSAHPSSSVEAPRMHSLPGAGPQTGQSRVVSTLPNQALLAGSQERGDFLPGAGPQTGQSRVVSKLPNQALLAGSQERGEFGTESSLHGGSFDVWTNRGYYFQVRQVPQCCRVWVRKVEVTGLVLDQNREQTSQHTPPLLWRHLECVSSAYVLLADRTEESSGGRIKVFKKKRDEISHFEPHGISCRKRRLEESVYDFDEGDENMLAEEPKKKTSSNRRSLIRNHEPRRDFLPGAGPQTGQSRVVSKLPNQALLAGSQERGGDGCGNVKPEVCTTNGLHQRRRVNSVVENIDG